MKSLRSLAILAGTAVFVSAAYAVVTGDGRSGGFHFTISDDDDGRSVRHMTHGDQSEFSLRENGYSIKAAWSGEFMLDESGDYIRTVDDELQIEITEDGEKERAVFEDGDGLEAVYYRNGDKQPEGEDTDKAVRALVLKFLRASGVKADERVAALLKRGDASAVLAEFDHLEGGHAKRRYTTALVEQADLTETDIIALTEALKDIESDHDLGGAIEAIVEQEDVTDNAAKALLATATSIESDHEMRQIVEAFAERPLDDAAMGLLLGLYKQIDSDHDLRVAAEALLENDAITPAQSARLLSAAARKIESDHDMRLVLTDSAEIASTDGGVAEAWFDAFDTISSSYDQRLALETLADAAEENPSLRGRYLAAVRTIDSDHERKRALEAIGDTSED